MVGENKSKLDKCLIPFSSWWHNYIRKTKLKARCAPVSCRDTGEAGPPLDGRLTSHPRLVLATRQVTQGTPWVMKEWNVIIEHYAVYLYLDWYLMTLLLCIIVSVNIMIVVLSMLLLIVRWNYFYDDCVKYIYYKKITTILWLFYSYVCRLREVGETRGMVTIRNHCTPAVVSYY